ncbi:hypothetical protein ACJA23_02685 [Mycoplasma corogypsi]|uniref:hypothetical protein n=1 Tax=Mycoplasma corogypsi TaxID=2106 RepID=UPI0038730678
MKYNVEHLKDKKIFIFHINDNLKYVAKISNKLDVDIYKSKCIEIFANDIMDNFNGNFPKSEELLHVLIFHLCWHKIYQENNKIPEYEQVYNMAVDEIKNNNLGPTVYTGQFISS